MKQTKFSTRKKLMASASMLMVSVMMLGSATYAWFSMNKEVTVDGMSVTAKSDTTFLVVKAVGASANTLAGVKEYNHTSDSAYTASAELYPAAHDTIEITDTATEVDASTSSVKDLWYYRYNADPTSSTNSMTDKTYIADASFDQYVLVDAFDLTVNGPASATITDLKVKEITINAEGDEAVKVLVVGTDGNEEFGAAGGNGTNTLCSSITNAALSQIKVYIYWDGNDADVYTNGAADLQNTEISITFEGTISNS